MTIEITIKGTSWYVESTSSQEDVDALIQQLNTHDTVSARVLPTEGTGDKGTGDGGIL